MRLEVHKFTAPQDPVVVSKMQRAVTWAGLGFKKRAAALADDVWRRAPGDKFVEVWAGQMLAKYGEPERAVEVYCGSEGLAPGNWEAYWNLGLFLVSCGERVRALVFLEEAVRIEPCAIDAHLDLARCLKELGRTNEAEQRLAEARQIDPKATL